MDNSQPDDDSHAPTIPTVETRLEISLVDAPHPAALEPDELLQQCELRTQRRSGPGGQHRNKTSSGVFLTHRPTGVIGEATERRSQADNRAVALRRLRYSLAVEVRTTSGIDLKIQNDLESQIHQRYKGHSMRLNESNVDKPAVLAMILNDMHAAGGQPSAVSAAWNVSTSRIVGLLKSYAPAFAFVNKVRQHHGRRALK